MHYNSAPHVPSPEDLTILSCRCGWRSQELTREQVKALGVPWYCGACDKQNLHWTIRVSGNAPWNASDVSPGE